MKFALIACAAVIGTQAIDVDRGYGGYGGRRNWNSGNRGGYGGYGLNRGYGGYNSYEEPVKARKVDYGSGFRIKAGRNVYNKDGRKA